MFENEKNVTSPIPGGGGGGGEESFNYGQLFFDLCLISPSPPSLHGNIDQGRTHPRTSLVHPSSIGQGFSDVCIFLHHNSHMICYACSLSLPNVEKSLFKVFFGRLGKTTRAADKSVVFDKYFIPAFCP
jgi:hypothetical protein